jgi:hypothetical protein
MSCAVCLVEGQAWFRGPGSSFPRSGRCIAAAVPQPYGEPVMLATPFWRPAGETCRSPTDKRGLLPASGTSLWIGCISWG